MVEVNDAVIKKLDELDQRYCDLEKQIADPAISCDTKKLIALSKEQGKIRTIIEKYRQFKKACKLIEEAESILADESCDKDFKNLAREEIKEFEDKKSDLFGELLDTLVMADDTCINSIIMEIRAGTGGDEAALFVRDLFNMYLKYAEGNHWKVEQLAFSATERGGFREVILGIKGNGVWADLGYEGGGHRVQRVPETETQGRVHTSAATVAVLPEPEELNIKIDPNDVLEHVSRSGGPGGQAVNKLNSAIKLEHVPTGITVSMQDEKSQHKNRSKAWRILRGRIYEHFESKKRAERDSQRKIMIGSGDRSQKIRTYNFPQNRVTDHRINLSLYCLDKVIAGNLGEVIDALKEHDKQQRLKNL